MSFLDRFRRNNQESVLPKEVKEYYQSERRQRRGVAIGLALAALLVTIAVAAGLFFGGRFIYNQIWGTDDNENQAATQNDDLPENEEDLGQNPADDSEEQSDQPQTPAPAPNPQPAPAPQPAPTPANPTTPSLGDEPLPHTGDEGM